MIPLSTVTSQGLYQMRSFVNGVKHKLKKCGTSPGFPTLFYWYTNPMTIRTLFAPVILLKSSFICANRVKPAMKIYRNPVIYAQELHEEMIRDDLTRKQLAERQGVSSDRITQWLCLLKLPKEKLNEIEALGDYWSRQMVTERELRKIRRSLGQKNKAITYN